MWSVSQEGISSGVQNFKMDKRFYTIYFLSVQMLWSHSLLLEVIMGQVLSLWSETHLGPGLVEFDSADETSTQYPHYGRCHSSLHACKDLRVSKFSSVFFLPVLKFSFLIWIPQEGEQELWLNKTCLTLIGLRCRWEQWLASAVLNRLITHWGSSWLRSLF